MNYTKAGTLKYLQEQLPSLHILPIFVVKSNAFFKDPKKTAEQVLEFANGEPLIVRSSSAMEDTAECSNAGAFTSLLYVEPELETVKAAIETVYHSYHTSRDEEILIQPMLRQIRKSGVVFTAALDTLAPYYVVNYSEGQDSAAVTSGTSNAVKTFVSYKYSPFPPKDQEIRQLLAVCSKIETCLGNPALDIEFAINEAGEIFILQARPIAGKTAGKPQPIDLNPALKRIYKKVKKLSARHPFLLGNTTCFGVMPDWNPAEILGARPKKLAISLYKELVTDQVWAHQRSDYGYRDLTMHPLMTSFCGVPYIDTRITFNSFIPKKLHERIAEKLVNYYLEKLARYPKYHDKVEFEIVFSCYYLGLPEQLNELRKYGFQKQEVTRIEFALLELTNQIISPKDGLYKKDMGKLSILEENYEKILHSDISLVDKIYWLMEECKSYGTLPFAGVARAAFVAVQFLRSFVQMDIIQEEAYHAYMNSLNTVSKKMRRDLKRLYCGELAKEEFLMVYGHIRPGTYDILSRRYDEAFEDYFGETEGFESQNDGEAEELPFSFSEDTMERIQLELDQNGLLISAEDLMLFIKESIEGREQLKFVFTKSVSKILQLIEELGQRIGIEKEELAYLDISRVRQLYVDLYAGDIRAVFLQDIEAHKWQYQNALQLRLPSMIVMPEDVYSFYALNEEPNYITQKSITAEVKVLTQSEDNLKGKIVMIQAADPGYDFLFSKEIGALITQFGGTNSHMAIRCAEMGIPAVIGAGEQNYSQWSQSKRLTVDCLKQQVIAIQ